MKTLKGIAGKKRKCIGKQIRGRKFTCYIRFPTLVLTRSGSKGYSQAKGHP